MEVHLVGPLPPPYGGVSVHVSRLRRQLLEAGHRCIVWGNHDRPADSIFRLGSPLRGFARLLRAHPDAIYHFHDSYLVAGLLAAVGRRVVFTVHNERIKYTLGGGKFPRQWLSRATSRRYFRKLRHIVAVSERARDELVSFGVAREAATVLNAYLRPGADETSHPDNVAAFDGFRARYGFIATANAWALNFFRGQDLYGIDLCLEMLARVRARRPDFGLVLALPLGRGTEYLGKLEAQARQLGVDGQVLWLLEPGAYHPLLRRCDLFLRPTNTDGFSVSIAESFEFGVPVVASDAVPRPAGCLVFRNRDVDDFVARVEQVLAERDVWAARSAQAREPDHFQELLALYATVPPRRGRG